MLDTFYDTDAGGFFDIVKDDEAQGYLKLREKPLPDNLLAIEGLLKLYNSTLDDRYSTIVGDTLKAYATTYGEYGEYAAAYGLMQQKFVSPQVEITIEGSPTDESTSELLKGAVQSRVPQLLIRPVFNPDHRGRAEAYICHSSVCMPPVQDVQGIRDQISSIQSNFELGHGHTQGQLFEHFQT